MSTSFDMLLRFPNSCDAPVTRGFEEDSCGKPAVAAVRDQEGVAWPVCAYHANRIGGCIPLTELIKAVQS